MLVYYPGLNWGLLSWGLLRSFFPKRKKLGLFCFGCLCPRWGLIYTLTVPAQRHAELAAALDQTWQNIGDYRVGPIENYVTQPGCHLVLTTAVHSNLIKPQLPQLIPIKEFYLPTGEPSVVLYALPSPLPSVIESGTVFGEQIMLQGFAMVSSSGRLTNLSAGDRVCLVLQWQALTDIGTDYTVFTHLIGPDSTSGLLAQHDGPPLHGMKPTSIWHRGDIIQDIHHLTIPSDAPSGLYQIDIGLYNALTGERLLTPTEGRSTDFASNRG